MSVIEILVYVGIVLFVLDGVWMVIQYRRGWRGGYFSHGLTRYHPRHNIKTGRRK
jgi:uncharacterized membrane protein